MSLDQESLEGMLLLVEVKETARLYEVLRALSLSMQVLVVAELQKHCKPWTFPCIW